MCCIQWRRKTVNFVAWEHIPPDDSLIWRAEDTAKLLRSAGETEAVVGRSAKADRRKSLEAIMREGMWWCVRRFCVYTVSVMSVFSWVWISNGQLSMGKILRALKESLRVRNQELMG